MLVEQGIVWKIFVIIKGDIECMPNEIYRKNEFLSLAKIILEDKG